MKTKIKQLILVVACLLCLPGCKAFKDAANKAGGKLFVPVVSTNTYTTNMVSRVPEVVLVGEGVYHTNYVEKLTSMPVTVISTNGWVLNPTVETGIQIAGDVAPFPWAGLVSSLVIGALGVGAAAKSRNWRKVASEGVRFGTEAVDRLKNYSKQEADELKRAAKTRQRATGVKKLVEHLLVEEK